MSYRLPPRPSGRMPVIHTVMQSDVLVDNGTIAHLAIPFFRKNGRIVTRADIMRIDHRGWPHPGHRDRSWQPCMSFNSQPVNLNDEGYESVEISFVTPPSGLTAVGDIDGNVVRIDVTSLCPDATSDDVLVPFSAYIVGESLRDVAIKGVLHIVAGPIDEGE